MQIQKIFFVFTILRTVFEELLFRATYFFKLKTHRFFAQIYSTDQALQDINEMLKLYIKRNFASNKE